MSSYLWARDGHPFHTQDSVVDLRASVTTSIIRQSFITFKIGSTDYPYDRCLCTMHKFVNCPNNGVRPLMNDNTEHCLHTLKTSLPKIIKSSTRRRLRLQLRHGNYDST